MRRDSFCLDLHAFNPPLLCLAYNGPAGRADVTVRNDFSMGLLSTTRRCATCGKLVFLNPAKAYRPKTCFQPLTHKCVGARPSGGWRAADFRRGRAARVGADGRRGERGRAVPAPRPHCQGSSGRAGASAHAARYKTQNTKDRIQSTENRIMIPHAAVPAPRPPHQGASVRAGMHSIV